MKTKKNLLFLLLLAVCFNFSSCSDVNKAEQLSGSWVTTITVSDDDGAQTAEQILTFNYEAETIKDDGTFVEIQNGRISNIEIEDSEDSYYNCSYQSSIKGRYEVLDGNLQLHYDMSTLKVTVKPQDIEFNINDEDVLLGMRALGISEEDFKKEMAEESQKEILDNLRSQYEADGRDIYYKDLLIEGAQMSIVTSEDGRIVYNRK